MSQQYLDRVDAEYKQKQLLVNDLASKVKDTEAALASIQEELQQNKDEGDHLKGMVERKVKALNKQADKEQDERKAKMDRFQDSFVGKNMDDMDFENFITRGVDSLKSQKKFADRFVGK